MSEASFATLNLGLHTGDAPEAVRENRRRVREALRLPGEPVWLDQVHGTEVVALGSGAVAERSDGPARADAAVTRESHRICAIQVADCIPVLLAARDGSAVGAAHAGWRGLVAGVLETAVHALAVDPPELVAWLGPAIGAAHFEVGGEVREVFLHNASRIQAQLVAAAFTPNARGRWQCDLVALARLRLASLGVSATYGGNWCTYTDPERFFSYRRDGRCGRMAALIWIES